MMRPLSLGLAFLFPLVVAFGQSDSSRAKPPAQSGTAAPGSSAALPHDRHGGLTISVDAYTNSERAKDRFGKSANPVPTGILPVEVFLKNETPKPIKIRLETVQLDVRLESGDQQLDWLSVNQVAKLIVHPGGNPSAPSERRFPVGIPTPSKDKKVDSIASELRPFALDSDVVPPLGTIHGFLFFDVSHNFEAALKSSLYVPDVALLPEQTPLMFFEVPLATTAATASSTSQP
jgi:hypothetical protein